MKRHLALIAGTMIAASCTIPFAGTTVALADGHGFHSQTNATQSFGSSVGSKGDKGNDGKGDDFQGQGSFSNQTGSSGFFTPGTQNNVSGTFKLWGNDSENKQDKQSEKKEKSNQQGNQTSTQTSTQTNNSGNSNTTSSTSSQQTHAAQLQQLHAALEQFHKDIETAHTVHKSLVSAVHDFVYGLQDAMAAGATSAVTDAMTQAKTTLTTLRTALHDQQAADSGAKTSSDRQQKGDLTEAINAIKAADAREVAKTKAMETAAKELETLAANLENAAAAANSTAPTNTTVNSTGNATVGNSTGVQSNTTASTN